MILARRRLLLVPLLLAAILPALPRRATAAGFPDITPDERTLTSAPGMPNASAVVLFKKGEFMMAGMGGNRFASVFSVQVRRKILTDDGKKYGEVTLHHSRWAKLQNFKGRTVLPDGRIVPLPDDAKFERRTSKNDKRFVTTVAFPAVQAGAILDYRYEIRIDSVLYLEPWYFQEEVPTLYSEIVYGVPSTISVTGWRKDPMSTGIQQDSKTVTDGRLIRVWGTNLPAVPDEPASLPFADLASRSMMIVTAFNNGYDSATFFQNWGSTCGLFGDDYKKAQRKNGNAQRMARQLTAQAATPRDKALAIHRFVRDQIEISPVLGVGLDKGSSVDGVLAAKSGDFTEKALLLQDMLSTVGLDARLVWVADRDGGAVDLQLPNPLWFDRAIVAVTLDGQRVFLDPADRSLGFGRLPPGLEGTAALLFDPKTPETLTLPVTPFTDHTRQAKMDLDLDADGRITGRGTLTLTGHHAWNEIDPQQDTAKVAKSWQDRLADDWKGYDVKDVEVKQSVDEERVEVTWTLAQREEEALGDEATIQPSVPLGPVHQMFTESAATRLSPVLLAFADRDDLELSLRWPEGWKPETLPKAASYQGPTGAVTASVDLKTSERTLTYHRRLDIKEKLLNGARLYQDLQTLYTVTERHDAQSLVLARH